MRFHYILTPPPSYVNNIYVVFIGQTLDESLKRETSTDCRNSTLPGICSKGAIIAVGSVQYGTKLTKTCGLSDTSDGCCDYDPEDCLIDYTGTIQQYVCSGRDVCGGGTVAKGDSSSCGDLYPIQNHYLTMEYYCIPGSIRASTRNKTVVGGWRTTKAQTSLRICAV